MTSMVLLVSLLRLGPGGDPNARALTNPARADATATARRCLVASSDRPTACSAERSPLVLMHFQSCHLRAGQHVPELNF